MSGHESFTELLDNLIEKNFKHSLMSNSTASKVVKQVIDVLDADVSDLDPELAAAIGILIASLFILSVVCCVWFQKCKCCCLCCFGRKLLPNTDAKDDAILGDEEYDPEAVHTDPRITKSKSLPKKKLRKYSDVDDGITPTSPAATESSENDERDEDEDETENESATGGLDGSGARTESAYEKDSRACCDAVASCMKREDKI